MNKADVVKKQGIGLLVSGWLLFSAGVLSIVAVFVIAERKRVRSMTRAECLEEKDSNSGEEGGEDVSIQEELYDDIEVAMSGGIFSGSDCVINENDNISPSPSSGNKIPFDETVSPLKKINSIDTQEVISKTKCFDSC